MSISTSHRLLISTLFFLQFSFTNAQIQTTQFSQDTIRLMAEEEERRLMDPALQRVPYERLDQARHALIKTRSANARAGIANVTWQERGPGNVGGRTRAFLFDPNDLTHKKVWAGSVTGGLWYTNDITDANAGWTSVSDAWENTVVTSIAADPSNPQIMYVCTGDAYNSVIGGGIWKTTNGGTTWTRLTSTIPSTNAPSITYGFGYIQRIIVNSSSQVFVATRTGVVRSLDGGTNWQYVLAPNQAIGASGGTGSYYNDMVTDLELATDGILYATFNPSRVFKSTDATNTGWIEITPANVSGERTELALAPSTSGAGQVLYGVSRAYNSSNVGKDVTWFKKSVNGGTTWTNLTIPTYASGSHFTNGSGYSALSLSVHPTDANTVYAGGYDWFRSTDGGASWSNQLTASYQYQQGLLFQPASNTIAVVFNDNGVYLSPDWGNNGQAMPMLNSRNNGYRAGEVSSISMKASPGSSYLLAGVRPAGYYQLTSAGLSSGTLFWNISYPGITFIDDNESSIQLIQSYNAIYQYTPSGSTQLASVNSYYSPIAADYDSQANTLYVADNINNQSFIRKVTGVGSTPQSTTLTLAGVTNLPSVLKLSADRTKLYVGTGSGQVYWVTNLTQATPTVTNIDNGALPPYTTVSSIDVGVDDELLVTFTNYGTQSVWYTSSGGTTWTGKDQTNYGLPDVPVRSGLFNPQNRKQVLLGTDAGVWSTDDITAANPGWAFTSAGMGAFRINQLRYRASDGRLTAATNGRGIWLTDAFAIPYTSPSVAITNISSTALCGGNTFSIAFSTSGPAFGSPNSFDVWVSDANGNFAYQRKIGSGTTSPISVTLPTGNTALPYGTNYQIKIIATNPEVESNPSDPLSIGNLAGAYVFDRRAEADYNVSAGTVCDGGQAILKVANLYNFGQTSTSTIPVDAYQWKRDGMEITGATAATVLAQQTGTYTVVLKQAGCTITSATYTLYSSTYPSSSIIANGNGEPRCDDYPLKLYSGYIGQTATYQWIRDGVDISGATSYTYVTTQTGNYTLRIADGTCGYTTAPVYYQFGRSINVSIAPLSLYQLSTADTLLCGSLGGNLYVSSSYTSSNTIQWYRDGNPIAGATSGNYSPYQPGIYSVSLKQGSCQAFSNGITISSTPFKAGIISSYGSIKAACPGETQSLLATPSINASYQWQKDGVDIPDATKVTLVPDISGNYTVRVTRGSCSATSEPISLTFSNAVKPTVSVIESCLGTNLNASGLITTSGYQFQWYLNGSSINFATSNYFYASQPGAYSVRVTNGNCTGLSKEVYANGGNGQLAKPVISGSPKLVQRCQNNSVQLTITTYSGLLQWKRNGVAIPGATTYQFYAVQSGIYSVVSASGNCQAESDPVEVKIGEATTATLSGNALISSGQSALLPVTFTGPAPWSFTLTNGQSASATYQNPAYISVSTTSNTTYQLASVANACGTGTVSGQANVAIGTGSADVSLSMAVDNRVPIVGEVVNYTMVATNSGPNDAIGVQVSSILPTGLAYVGSSSPGVSVANGIVNADLGTIQANQAGIISFQVTPTQPGIYDTSAQITSTQTPDPDSQPNSGTGDGQDDEVMVELRTPNGGNLVASANPNQVPLPGLISNQPIPSLNSADLSLAMQVNNPIPAVAKNDLVTAGITVSNRGGSSASSIVVQVVLPNGALVTQNSVGWLPVDSQTYKRIINTLPAGQSTAISLQWQPTAGGILKAQIFDVAEPDPDSTPGNGYSLGEDDEASIMIRIR